jgi:hypothetical protein
MVDTLFRHVATKRVTSLLIRILRRVTDRHRFCAALLCFLFSWGQLASAAPSPAQSVRLEELELPDFCLRQSFLEALATQIVPLELLKSGEKPPAEKTLLKLRIGTVNNQIDMFLVDSRNGRHDRKSLQTTNCIELAAGVSLFVSQFAASEAVETPDADKGRTVVLPVRPAMSAATPVPVTRATAVGIWQSVPTSAAALPMLPRLPPNRDWRRLSDADSGGSPPACRSNGYLPTALALSITLCR